MKLKNVIIISIVLAFVGSVYYLLRKNKQETKSEIAIASRKISAIPVEIDTAHLAYIRRTLSSNGLLEANNQLIVISETQGKILHVYKHLGDFVRKGEVIAKVEDQTIKAAEMVADANLKQHERDIMRYKRLRAGDAITKHDLEEAKIGLEKAKADFIKAKKALENTSITAPIPGIINQKFITVGQFITGGMPVCQIVDNHVLKLHVKVAGNNIYNIKKGQVVDVHVPVFPGRTFKGKVTAIGVKADKAMNFDVEIKLDNTHGIPLKSGLYAEVNFPVQSKKCLVIPKECIIGSMIKPQVFVVKNERAVLTNIVTGIYDNKNIQVVSGLKAGKRVVYNGQLNLSGNEKVKIIR